MYISFQVMEDEGSAEIVRCHSHDHEHSHTIKHNGYKEALLSNGRENSTSHV